MSKFSPLVAPSKTMREFSLRALILGCILSLVFGVGNTYLALKVGTTISASIPAAVLSMAIMRAFFKRATVLENNLVQSIAAVGEGLAAGVAFTVPALFLLGSPPSLFHVFLLSVLGATLGVLFMIPMRRYIIVQEHGKLPFPEGVACAKILETGAKGGRQATYALIGIAVGALYQVFASMLHLWDTVATWKVRKLLKTDFSIECTPALLGVGVIIGPRIASLLFFGGMLAWWVLIPLIAKFGMGTTPIFPGRIPVEQMTPDEIWSNYIRYIGAGTVGIGGIVSLLKIAPLLRKTFHVGLKELFQRAGARKKLPRTDQDISLRWLILGSISIILFLWLYPGFHFNLLTIALLTILGFFFVAVISITVGLVGSTSCPVSGMTITTLLITCLIFVALGWTEKIYLLSAIMMSIVANIAIALGSTTSQDLKTGFLLGATPRHQQVGEIIGAILPALTIGATLYILNATYTFGSAELPAPQGTLMALIAKGVISGNIPYGLVIIGVILGLLVEMLGLPVLPFAIGLYLPLSLSTSVMIGGLFSLLLRRTKKESVMERGVLTSSGLVAGDACMGVLVAFFAAAGWVNPSAKPLFPNFISLAIYLLIGLFLVRLSLKKRQVR